MKAQTPEDTPAYATFAKQPLHNATADIPEADQLIVGGKSDKAGFRKAEADVKTNMVSLGVRAESHLKVGKATVIPHAGLRYTHAKSSDFDTKVDGKTVWNTESSGVNTFQMPIGVSARADITTKNGWTLRPHGDVSIVPNFGNTKQSSTIKNVRGVSDGIESDFTGSDKGKADHTIKFELRQTF